MQPGQSGRASLVLAFALSVLAVLVVPWCTRDRAAEPSRWLAIVRSSALLQPGDVVLVHPPWREDVAHALRSSGALGLALATTALSPRHGDDVPAVLVISDGSAPLPRALRARVQESEQRDGFEIARLAASRSASGARSLLDGLARARVELVALANKADVVACPWDTARERHECAGMPEWLHVGVEQLQVDGETVRCAWAHPMTDKLLVIRFARERLQDTLLLSLALSDGAAQNYAAAPVTAVLRIDGSERARLTRPAGARGFASQSVAVPAGHDLDIELTITTSDDAQRHTCFKLETLETRETLERSARP